MVGLTNPQNSTGFSFGQMNPPASSGGFSLGNAPMTTSSGSSFGSVGGFQTSSATPSFGLGTGLNLGQTTAASSPFGLSSQSGASTSTSSGFALASGGAAGQTLPASSGFSLGQATAATSLPSISLGQSLLTATTTTSLSQGLGGTAPAVFSSTSSGLGGFQPASVSAGVGSTIKVDGKSAKGTPLPNEIFSTISPFESYKDGEKKASEENIRQTAAPFHKLCEDTKKLKQHILKLSNQHSQLHSNGKKLKTMVLQDSENVEMARRTQDTPMTLQGNNKAPEHFFFHLVRSYEERMSYCKNKIDEIERCSAANLNSLDVTPEDMSAILQKEHETVKMLASHIYNLHNQLLEVYQKSNNAVQPIPEALFKSGHKENERSEITLKDSSVLRPCLEGGSGLLNFQSGQQRAKAALSLGGAAPPAISLMQSPLHGGFGTSTSGNKLFELNKQSFGLNQSLNPIGGGNTFNQNSFNMFPSSNSSIFGAKPFGKTTGETDESQRKRRI